MKKGLSLLVITTILFCFMVSCARQEIPIIVGKWNTEIVMVDADDLGEDYQEFEGKLVMIVTYEFLQDGSYSIDIDKGASKENYDKFVDDLVDYSEKITYEIFAEDDITKEEADKNYEELYDSSIHDYFVKTFEEEMSFEDILDSIGEKGQKTGKYKVEENRLFKADDSGIINEDEYVTFELNDAELKFVSSTASEDTDSYPIVLKKFK